LNDEPLIASKGSLLLAVKNRLGPLSGALPEEQLSKATGAGHGWIN
jgi:hypothetical protein